MNQQQNDLISLAVRTSNEQPYQLIPFANINSYLTDLAEMLSNISEIKDTVYELISTYNPKTEIVLLSFEEELVTVAIVKK